MQKINDKFFLLIFIVFILLSCSKNNNSNKEIDEHVTKLLPLIEQRLGKVNANKLHYNQELNGVVYDDMVFPLDMVDLKKSSSQAAQTEGQYSSYFVSYAKSNSAKYYIDPSFPSNYIGPLRTAAKHWSNASDNISFTETTTKSLANLICEGKESISGAAYAQYPDGSGNIGNRLYVKPSVNNKYTYGEKLTLMVHEMGHVLTLNHSDENTGTNAPCSGTHTWHAANNCGSVMRSRMYTCGWTSTIANWSLGDKYLIEKTYKFKNFSETPCTQQ